MERNLNLKYQAFLLIAFLFLIGCGGGEGDDSPKGESVPDELVKTWMLVSEQKSNCPNSSSNGTDVYRCTAQNCQKLTFNENGTFRYVSTTNGVDEIKDGSFSINGGSITLCPNGEDCYTESFTLSNSSLTSWSIQEDNCRLTINWAPLAETLAEDVLIDKSVKSEISPYFFGQNYWSWVESFGAQIKGTESLMKEVKLDFIRMGGTEADRNNPEAFDYAKIDEAVVYANELGAEIVLQIPLLNDYNQGSITVEEAMDIVRYVRDKGYPITRFSIGNEPDIYHEQGQKSGYTVNDLGADFNRFSQAIKAIDASYEVMGPDLAYKYYPDNNWLEPFLASSKDHLDIISVHRYVTDPDKATIQNIKNDDAKFRSDLQLIKGYIQNQGLGANFPIAITEAHVTYNGEQQYEGMEASPSSFWAAMWVADVIGVGLEEGLWNLSFWSISEGWTLGFINGETGEPRPTYYALKLMSNYTGSHALKVDYDLTDVSVYASEDDNNRTIITIINKREDGVSLDWRLSDNEEVNTITLNPLSINLLVIENNQVAEQLEYNQEMAASGQGPVIK